MKKRVLAGLLALTLAAQCCAAASAGDLIVEENDSVGEYYGMDAAADTGDGSRNGQITGSVVEEVLDETDTEPEAGISGGDAGASGSGIEDIGTADDGMTDAGTEEIKTEGIVIEGIEPGAEQESESESMSEQESEPGTEQESEQESEPGTEPEQESETGISLEEVPETEMESAAEEEYDAAANSGTFENLRWSLSAQGVLTVSGVGAMPGAYEDDTSNYPWEYARDTITEVVIEDGVTSISDGAFWECLNLKTVTIADTVTSIALDAFYFDVSLTTINWGNGLKTIGESAFNNCTSLTSLELPESVETIGRYAFDTCEMLEEVILGNRVQTIGESAFSLCESLTSITIPESVTSIGDWAFDTCTALETVRFKGNAPEMGEEVFLDDTLKAYYPSGNATWTDIVEQSKKYGAQELEWLPSGIEWELAGEVLTIKAWDLGADEFETFEDAPWYEERLSVGKIVIEEEVEKLGAYAFEGCDSVRCVWFEGEKPEMNHYAFQGVTATAYCRADKDWFSASYGNYCGDIDWIRWRLEDSVLVLDGQGEMQDYSVNTSDMPWYEKRNSVTEAEIGNGITKIGESAFARWRALKKVMVKKSVTEIGERAFGFANGLEEADLEHAGIEETGKEVFYACSSLKKIKWPDNLKKVSEKSFYGCHSLEQVYIPDGVCEIGEKAFSECSALKKAVIHEDVVLIGEEAFQNPTGLCGYDEAGGSYIQQYAQANNLQYAVLDMADRSVPGFSAARDGWSLINDPDYYGGYRIIPEYLYYDVYDVTPSSIVSSSVISNWHAIQDLFGMIFDKEFLEGRCFGFSVTAAGNYSGLINLSDYFDRPGDGLNEYGYSDIVKFEKSGEQEFFSIKGNSRVLNLIDRAHISQKSCEFGDAEIFKGDEDYSELMNYITTGSRAPLIITLETFSGYMHAVALDTAYQNLAHDGDWYRIPVYDSNYPYITTHLDCPGMRYTHMKSYLWVNIATGEWKLEENSKTVAESGYRFLTKQSIRFFDLRKLPSNFFTGVLSLWLPDRIHAAIMNNADGWLTDCSVKGMDGQEWLRLQNGDITFISDCVSVGGTETAGGKLTSIELDLPATPFVFETEGARLTVTRQSQYLCAVVDNTSELAIDPAAVTCEVKSEEKTQGAVFLQKNIGKNQYMAAGFKGVIEQNDVRFSINSDNTASVDAQNEEMLIQAVVDNGKATADYENIPVKYAKDINPEIPVKIPEQGDDQSQVHVHSFGAWVVDSVATVFAPASEKRTCAACGSTETRTVGTKLQPSIEVNATSFPLKVNSSTKKLKVSGLAAGDYVKSWKSSNTKIVKVSGSGKITAKKKTGKAVITITLASGLSRKVRVKVQKDAVKTKKIIGTPKKLKMKKGSTQKLKAIVSPITSNQKISYASSDKKTATVSSKGIIKARKKGKAVITVKSGSKSVKIKVTVK